jgi:hypothetical protein
MLARGLAEVPISDTCASQEGDFRKIPISSRTALVLPLLFPCSFSTASVRSFQPAAVSSKAGRLVFDNASREEERESREVVRAIVVRCKEMNVG